VALSVAGSSSGPSLKCRRGGLSGSALMRLWRRFPADEPFAGGIYAGGVGSVGPGIHFRHIGLLVAAAADELAGL
jgi:hypothetical protein